MSRGESARRSLAVRGIVRLSIRGLGGRGRGIGLGRDIDMMLVGWGWAEGLVLYPGYATRGFIEGCIYDRVIVAVM